MTQPAFYVSPEQQIRDRADFARAGIARGRSVAVVRYKDGILFVAENRSQSLHKVAEIYDRIGFAAVGRYNEFENLRIAGIRHADVRGYAYDRRDVTGRMLANAYAQLLGTIFSSVMEKPWEVELVVAEVGDKAAEDRIFRIAFDGSVGDEADFAVMGGAEEAIAEALRAQYEPNLPLRLALICSITALNADPRNADEPLTVASLEVGVLDRTRSQTRKFQRFDEDAVAQLLNPKRKPARRTRKKASPAEMDAGGETVAEPPSSVDSAQDAAGDTASRPRKRAPRKAGPAAGEAAEQ
ncbi:MAG: proteasome subunit alpha [Propionibacteriaceae bacterium]|jgi:proteasome alpha subunit|nr:proteasome subunit alpha [Propionibacteriaceae bacterium]